MPLLQKKRTTNRKYPGLVEVGHSVSVRTANLRLNIRAVRFTPQYAFCRRKLLTSDQPAEPRPTNGSALTVMGAPAIRDRQDKGHGHSQETCGDAEPFHPGTLVVQSHLRTGWDHHHH
jgi:hypothetical protein